MRSLSRSRTLEQRLRGIIGQKFEYFAPYRALVGTLSAHIDPAHPLSPFSKATATIRERDIGFFDRASRNQNFACRPPSCLTSHGCSGSIRWGSCSSGFTIARRSQARTHLLFDKTLEHDAARVQACGLPFLKPLYRTAASCSKPSMETLIMTAVALRIVIPGGSGQVGRMLAQFFQERGHHVTVLTRGPYTAPWQTVHWDGKSLGPWVETLEGADVCIHLSGRSVNCRSTARQPTRALRFAYRPHAAAASGLRLSGQSAAALDERVHRNHLPASTSGTHLIGTWTRQLARSAATK